MNEPRTLPYDVRCVAIDETEHWNLDPADMARIKALRTIYAYDKNTHVYACEMTPSYELWPVDVQAIYVDERDFDDDEQDRFRERIYDLQNEYMEHEVLYMHVRDVDRIEESANPDDYLYAVDEVYELDPEWFDSEDEQWESILDGLRCNSIL